MCVGVCVDVVVVIVAEYSWRSPYIQTVTYRCVCLGVCLCMRACVCRRVSRCVCVCVSCKISYRGSTLRRLSTAQVESGYC